MCPILGGRRTPEATCVLTLIAGRWNNKLSVITSKLSYNLINMNNIEERTNAKPPWGVALMVAG
jgi:hypothetical protein